MAAHQNQPAPTDAPRPDEDYVPRVVLKFHDDVKLPYDQHAAKHIAERFPDDWDQLVKRFPNIQVLPLFESVTVDELRALVDEAMALDEDYHPPNFFTFFAVQAPPGVDPELVARQLTTWKSIEEAYVQSPPTEPPIDPDTQFQTYLNAQAIDALAAWQVPGGDGLNVHVAEIEQGWTVNHQDFQPPVSVNGHNHAYLDHGTSVLGIVLAAQNGVGGQGIAYSAQVRAVSEWRTSQLHNVPDAIAYATNNLRPGDIMLIETQLTLNRTLWPVEVETANYDAIRLATARQISVVEPAGNDANDLRDFVHPTYGRVLDPASNRDSGAIMVGAGLARLPHNRTGLSNYGDRIDCFAWGEQVYTASSGASGASTNAYTGDFGGTSAAAAIIAGVAASVQGISRAAPGNQVLDAQRLRSLLREPTLGTPAAPSARIRVMPNLGAIAAAWPWP
jgi:subtilisin family serine protease